MEMLKRYLANHCRQQGDPSGCALLSEGSLLGRRDCARDGAACLSPCLAGRRVATARPCAQNVTYYISGFLPAFSIQEQVKIGAHYQNSQESIVFP